MTQLKKVDPAIVDRMKEELGARMEAAPAPGAWGCVVLLTARSNLYSEVIPWADDYEAIEAAEKRLVAQLFQAGDTEVEYIYDFAGAPSCRVVKLLMELHPRNGEAQVIARSPEGGYLSKPLRTFQPPKK